MLNIDRDLGRFRDIVRGKVRKDLRKHVFFRTDRASG